MMKLTNTLFLLLVALFLCARTSSLLYPANSPGFRYTGRWQLSSGLARADWPCSSLQFRVTCETDTCRIKLHLNLRRTRVRVAVSNSEDQIESFGILQGGNDPVYEFASQPGESYTVSLTKLTQASPYNNGVGKWLTSILEFQGVDLPENVNVVETPLQQQSRRIQLIGASDTAGFCVDGTPETSDAKMFPYAYDNCDSTSHAVLARRFEADLSVQAIAGIGLTQNAFANMQFLLGGNTMPEFYKREMQTQSHPLWEFENSAQPDLLLISLGGNDFNHQKHVPSSDTFSAAYHDFLDQIIEPYQDSSQELTIVSICGQGDPTEHERDPNNDRCRPCPHVEDATQSYDNSKNPNVRLHYIHVPCDGSVVTGIDDIGCEGHKNRLGQLRVADFLEPRLREIMGWQEDENDAFEFPTDASSEYTTSWPDSHYWILWVGLAVVMLLLLLVVIFYRRCASRNQQARKYSKQASTASTLVDESDSDEESLGSQE